MRYTGLYFIAVFIYVYITLNNHNPFYDPQRTYPNHVFVIAGFASICLLLYSVQYYLAHPLFNNYFNIEQWTLGKELRSLSFFFLASLAANGIFAHYFIAQQLDNECYFGCILHISATANLMPFVLVSLIRNKVKTISLKKTENANENR